MNKKGIVTDKRVHKAVLKEITEYFNMCGLSVCGLTFSGIKGSDGNIEYLAYLKKSEIVINSDINTDAVADEAFNSL